MQEAPKTQDTQNSNNELSRNNKQSNLFTNDCVSSSRVIYTPSNFARTSLLFLQETGVLKAIRPHVSSRQNLQSYLLLLITDGSGWIEYEGKRYELKKGDISLIDCKKGYSQSSNEELWAARWVHWSGGNMPAVYNKIRERGLKVTFHPGDINVYTDILEELYEVANGSSFVRDVKINTLLSEMIGLLFAETVYEEGEQPVANTGDKGATAIDVPAIKSYIDTHYQDQLTLELLAERFFFSKHYLARAFKESYGMSVGSYIQLVRISKSKELLRFTDMSIEQCGYASGYNDANFYSRTFRKVEGCSPSEFRKNWRSGGKEPVDNTEEK